MKTLVNQIIEILEEQKKTLTEMYILGGRKTTNDRFSS